MAMPYVWRQLTEKQREELLAWRKERERPWHTPPHRPNFGRLYFHVTAACYEHAAIIGGSVARLDGFSRDLLDVFSKSKAKVAAWCVLPNHYHALIETENVLKVFHEIGRLHGRESNVWNAEDQRRGRKVFHGASDRALRSERHYWATMNYIHHNPVHHGYVRRWIDWRWSSGADFIEHNGREETERIWRMYPLRDYGARWDDAML